MVKRSARVVVLATVLLAQSNPTRTNIFDSVTPAVTAIAVLAVCNLYVQCQRGAVPSHEILSAIVDNRDVSASHQAEQLHDIEKNQRREQEREQENQRREREQEEQRRDQEREQEKQRRDQENRDQERHAQERERQQEKERTKERAIERSIQLSQDALDEWKSVGCV
jgi:membrane protein involved in colicin uptake